MMVIPDHERQRNQDRAYEHETEHKGILYQQLHNKEKREQQSVQDPHDPVPVIPGGNIRDLFRIEFFSGVKVAGLFASELHYAEYNDPDRADTQNNTHDNITADIHISASLHFVTGTRSFAAIRFVTLTLPCRER
jgi:hypothetical protein